MESKPMQALRKLALRFPEVQEGVTCNKAAFKARGKAFLFVGGDAAAYNIMLKLSASLPEASKLAAKSPANYRVGGHGWVTVIFPHAESAPAGLLEKWIEESFRLLAPKQVVAMLAAGAAPKTARKKS